MPLRVAEKDGYIYAVNGCGDCPFNGFDGHAITFCIHKEAKKDEELLYRDHIPVWCPLPEPGIQKKEVGELIKKLDRYRENKEELAALIRGWSFYRGPEFVNVMESPGEPEPIPPAFIVEDVEIISSVSAYIWIKPVIPRGPSYEYLRKGDGLVAHDEKGSYGYGILETPTSSKVMINTVGRDPQKGDRLTALSPKSEET